MIGIGYFFTFLHKIICRGYSLKSPHRGNSNGYPQHLILWRNTRNNPKMVIKYSFFRVFMLVWEGWE